MRGVAHLRDGTGHAGRVGIVHGLDRVDREHDRFERGRRTPRPRATMFPRRRTTRARARPSRSARIRTCAVDSSAHTSRHRAPRAAIAPSACMSSVLLPIPGSPPISVTEPATRPPPSTRSNSVISVGRCEAPAASTWPIGVGTLRSATARRPADARGAGLRLRHGAPLAALGATAEPLGRLVAARGADEQRRSNRCSGHGATVVAGVRQRRGTPQVVGEISA